MKAIRNVLVLTALCVAASAQSKSGPAAEQRYFNLEDKVQNRVDLSDAELAVLAADNYFRAQPQSSATQLIQEGLAATVVHLCGSGERDLVVLGAGPQFAGANGDGPFWIIRDLPAGPAVVLSEISLALTIDTKRSNKCLNIETLTATAAASTTTEFHFNGQKYVVYKQKTSKLGQ